MPLKMRIVLLVLEVFLLLFTMVVTFSVMFAIMFAVTAFVELEGLLFWIGGMISFLLGVFLAIYILKIVISRLPKNHREKIEEFIDEIQDAILRYA